MRFLGKLSDFVSKGADIASKLEAKTAILKEDAIKYAEDEIVKEFDKIKAQLVEINKKQRELGIKETTIFDFFKDHPEYVDLLEIEKAKINN